MAQKKAIYDGGWIIPGLIVFVAILSYPLLHNVAFGKGTAEPELPTPKSEKCVRDKAEMRAVHMDVLDDWRHRVVRFDERNETTPDGVVEMSLTKTCLNEACHASSKDFCARCHDWQAVKLTCWGCHVEPEGSR